jgi:hypothetical protein
MSFLVFNKDRLSRYTVFSGRTSILSKISLCSILGLKSTSENYHFLGSCGIVKTYLNNFYLHSHNADGYILDTKKLDLSMYCMRGVTELSKLSNLSGGNYTFRTDCIFPFLKLSLKRSQISSQGPTRVDSTITKSWCKKSQLKDTISSAALLFRC